MHRDEKHSDVEKTVELHVGRRLPGERELAEQIGISRPRLRAILMQLEAEGRVQRRHGSGTYALEVKEDGLRSVVLLLDAALKLGDDPFISRCVEQLQAVLQDAGVHCFIQRAGASASVLGLVAMPPVEGIVALGVAAHAVLADAPFTELPAIALFGDVSVQPGRKSSLLELDDEDAGAKAARRLVQSGVERVLFYGRPALPAVRERLKGIERELSGTDTPLEIVSCGMNYHAGFEQGRAIATPAQERLGIIAANDWLAVGLQAGLQSQAVDSNGLPTLVSFDGLPVAARMEPPIASLAVPIDTLCEDALTELERLQRANAKGRTIRYALDWV
jgi:DNA-binding LacI/PurR family transcriptional regulator